SVRNGFLNPRSFGARMIELRLPPSSPTRTVLRALVPFVPRPAVLPFEPSPRPTRVRAFFAPGAGRRWWALSSWTRSALASCVAALAGAFAVAGFSTFAAAGFSAFAAAGFAAFAEDAALAGALAAADFAGAFFAA